ncbi:MAG TPA: hypothetical protein VK009_08450 [Chloroflexota bacterium]|nr:hypothetical protein [Chloroflexota bacterium]
MDVLNTPFNTVLEKTREEIQTNPAGVHFVTFDPVSREVAFAHGDDFNAVPEGQQLIYRFEKDELSLPGFREAWNQNKTDVLRAVEKRDKRFAHLG